MRCTRNRLISLGLYNVGAGCHIPVWPFRSTLADAGAVRPVYQLKLRPQAFQVLQVLVEHAGDVVTREELRRMLWPAGTFVDFEHGLNSSVKELRRALRDSAVESRYIETLPKVGYRMIVAVIQNRQAPSLRSSEVEIPRIVLPETKPTGSPQRTWMLYATLALFVAALAGYWQWSRANVRAQPAQFMLAVLPFENLTGDASQEYLSDGLTEEMIAQFGRLDPRRASA